MLPPKRHSSFRTREVLDRSWIWISETEAGTGRATVGLHSVSSGSEALLVQGFGPRPGGQATGMPGIPQQRQSLRPPVPVLVAAAVIAVALVAVWFAVGAAVGSGGDDCPAKGTETAERCR
jgi:hypothetical protein